jgi:hypothetical protein
MPYLPFLVSAMSMVAHVLIPAAAAASGLRGFPAFPAPVVLPRDQRDDEQGQCRGDDQKAIHCDGGRNRGGDMHRIIPVSSSSLGDKVGNWFCANTDRGIGRAAGGGGGVRGKRGLESQIRARGIHFDIKSFQAPVI